MCFKKVSFAYQDAAILEDVSFTVAPGQTVAIVGPSGSGKSTIINLLPRFYEPSAGQITPMANQSLSFLFLICKYIALVSQESVLFDDTVAANIAFGRQGATDEDIRVAAMSQQQMNLLNNCRRSCAAVGEGGNKLSGGSVSVLPLQEPC